MTVGSFVLYDDDGVIHRVISFDTGGLNLIPGSADDETERVDLESMAIVPKLEMAPIATVDGMAVTLSGLPDGALVDAGEIQATAETGQAELVFKSPGEKAIRITAKHHLKHRLVVHVDLPEGG